jgi:hypothetical protein
MDPPAFTIWYEGDEFFSLAGDKFEKGRAVRTGFQSIEWILQLFRSSSFPAFTENAFWCI